MTDTIKTTPLHDLHRELGARMVPFAGWDMPVQYPTGILTEHLHTRQAAGLFDVSHMGQLLVTGPDPAGAIERLVPADIAGLGEGKARYTVLTAPDGGILDDLIVTKDAPDRLFVVVNAGCADADIAHLKAALEPEHKVEHLADRALLAVQGPQAIACVAHLVPEAADLGFMESLCAKVQGVEVRVSRLGYTGEDGAEISVPAAHAVKFARTLLAMEAVKPVGLGARDSLRLEAGLCLYGHDIDLTTSPIEANLAWTIGKRRREGGGFPGAERILRELAEKPARRLVGLKPEGKAPAREGAEITSLDGTPIGKITSGGFGPSVGGPVAMGYVAAAHAAADTPVQILVRGRPLAATVVKLPFTPHRYARRGA
ncbi:glycine cleavage system aminomethyltransferase GcvT [Geminicoccus roseus]|uniref:glycine cleavage system aminomethyltransferase GcvT n=1 Tax=Geminicoccus roseus TaxID=404900 RepID=UPI0003F72312|nr:glycine cleavage system aminomethyltransferase GcvT [Geminicoccus roseus]